MGVLTTPTFAFPYPDGNDPITSGDNRMGDLGLAIENQILAERKKDMCILQLNDGIVIPVSAAYTKLGTGGAAGDWSELYDPKNMHDLVTNPSRIIVNTTGVWEAGLALGVTGGPGPGPAALPAGVIRGTITRWGLTSEMAHGDAQLFDTDNHILHTPQVWGRFTVTAANIASSSPVYIEANVKHTAASTLVLKQWDWAATIFWAKKVSEL